MAALFNRKNYKEEEVTDLGLSNKVISLNQRLVNKDGSFNTVRKGLPYHQTFSIYQYLSSISWMKFCAIVFAAYIIINIFFAFLYFIGGEENFVGIKSSNEFERFLNDFFFSTQTFTTVGYGRVNPVGIYSNVISSIESLTGLLSLALATGLLYSRFSRPVAKILYSDNALVAPYKDITALQFRIANKRRDHQMVDVEAEIMFSKVENGQRKFFELKLEYNKIHFFSLTWTVNHPIDENSPLYGLTEEDYRNLNVEFLILLKGFDDTFAQIVHSRSSYKYDEIIWNAKFLNIYSTTDDGKSMIELDKISDYEKVLI